MHLKLLSLGGAIIGANVNLHKGCTIGAENRGERKGCPIIGEKVYVGINSTIVGNIHVGNDSSKYVREF
mgnify:CR=1 FL=1